MSNQPKKKKNPTSASAWKGKDTGSALELPSGNVALVRAPGMQVFVQKGFIPNSLLPIIQEAINKKKAPEMDKVELTPETLAEMSELMDAVCVHCVIEPKVHSVPTPVLDPESGSMVEPDRSEDILYIDEVDLADKTFIFQFAVGGTRDLEQFRKGLEAGVGDLSALAESGDSAE